MAKSIMQTEEECFVCKTTQCLEEHHVIYGRGYRPLSDKYGLTVKLCPRHHRGDDKTRKFAVHFNPVLDEKLKKLAQQAFMKAYPDKDFVKIFGRNYL